MRFTSLKPPNPSACAKRTTAEGGAPVAAAIWATVESAIASGLASAYRAIACNRFGSVA